MRRSTARLRLLWCRARGPRAAVSIPVLAVLPGLAAAQTATNNLLGIALGAGLVLLAGVIFYLVYRVRALAQALQSQSDDIAGLAQERDTAIARLAQQAQEFETQLGEQLQELENENEELSEATAKLRKLVVVDELTGLSNRMHFDQVLPHEIKRALREEKPLSIILGRFDWADAFQQSYGRERFDEALNRIAEEVRTIFRRAGDLPARYNDDSFAVIFTSDGDVAVRFAERLRKAIWNIPIPNDASQTADRVTFSLGVATIQANKVHDPKDFRQAAETATRIAEGKGGNHVEEYRKPPAEPSAV